MTEDKKKRTFKYGPLVMERNPSVDLLMTLMGLDDYSRISEQALDFFMENIDELEESGRKPHFDTGESVKTTIETEWGEYDLYVMWQQNRIDALDVPVEERPDEHRAIAFMFESVGGPEENYIECYVRVEEGGVTLRIDLIGNTIWVEGVDTDTNQRRKALIDAIINVCMVAAIRSKRGMNGE